MERMVQSIDEARTQLEEAQNTLSEAMRKRDMVVVLSAADAVRTAEKLVDKLNKEAQKSQYEANKELREAAVTNATALLDEFVKTPQWTEYQAAGVTGFGVVFKEGVPELSVKTIGAPRGSRTNNTAGGSRGRLVHLVDGTQYKSKEFLTQFGEGALGAEKMNDVWNKAGGFQAGLKQVAAKLKEQGKDYQLMKMVDGELVTP